MECLTDAIQSTPPCLCQQPLHGSVWLMQRCTAEPGPHGSHQTYRSRQQGRAASHCKQQQQHLDTPTTMPYGACQSKSHNLLNSTVDIVRELVSVTHTSASRNRGLLAQAAHAEGSAAVNGKHAQHPTKCSTAASAAQAAEQQQLQDAVCGMLCLSVPVCACL